MGTKMIDHSLSKKIMELLGVKIDDMGYPERKIVNLTLRMNAGTPNIMADVEELIETTYDMMTIHYSVPIVDDLAYARLPEVGNAQKAALIQ